MNSDNILLYLRENSLNKDNSFSFHCDGCGKCCYNRNDIILSPIDIIRIAKHFDRTNEYIISRYCGISIGSNSLLPIVYLKFSGKNGACPFLDKKKCSIHEDKPSVCVLFPLGRAFNNNEKGFEYFLQPITCGDLSEKQKVNDWISKILPYEDASNIWNNTVMEWTTTIHDIHEKISKNSDVIPLLYSFLIHQFYLEYNTSEDINKQLADRKLKLDRIRSKLISYMSE